MNNVTRELILDTLLADSRRLLAQYEANKSPAGLEACIDKMLKISTAIKIITDTPNK